MQDNMYFKKNLQELINCIDNQIVSVRRDAEIPINVRENMLAQLINLKQTYIEIFNKTTDIDNNRKFKNVFYFIKKITNKIRRIIN